MARKNTKSGNFRCHVWLQEQGYSYDCLVSVDEHSVWLKFHHSIKVYGFTSKIIWLSVKNLGTLESTSFHPPTWWSINRVIAFNPTKLSAYVSCPHEVMPHWARLPGIGWKKNNSTREFRVGSRYMTGGCILEIPINDSTPIWHYTYTL